MMVFAIKILSGFDWGGGVCMLAQYSHLILFGRTSNFFRIFIMKGSLNNYYIMTGYILLTTFKELVLRVRLLHQMEVHKLPLQAHTFCNLQSESSKFIKFGCKATEALADFVKLKNGIERVIFGQVTCTVIP